VGCTLIVFGKIVCYLFLLGSVGMGSEVDGGSGEYQCVVNGSALGFVFVCERGSGSACMDWGVYYLRHYGRV
jgi:hypothetical protein